MELHVVSYGIDSVAQPLLLFFSSDNRLLWFRYREYDLAHSKLVFEFCIYRVWSRCRYDVSSGLDTVYREFFRVGTTLDIFQNIHILYFQYGVLVFSGYGVLILFSSWSLVSTCTDTQYLLDGYGVLVEWNGSDLYQVTCPWGDQFVVNLSERVCSCRKWELSGIPCTHAVASIWDQANNGIDTGIPESYCLPVHWLTTWKEMYKFKINPVNGPQGWKKSDVPTTIIPPKPHPQIGRPPKKRKKSAAELADEMMKSKKLTKTGKSVTCKSCKQVGHNSRGCKSKKGGGSQQAGVAGHGDAAHGSQQAGVHGSQTTQSTPQAS
ncbi:mutator type transposase [Tanacetum coccineum]